MKFVVFGNVMAYDQELLAELNERLEDLNMELVSNHFVPEPAGYIYFNIQWQTLLKRILKAYPVLKTDGQVRKDTRQALIDKEKQCDVRAERLGDACFAIGENDLQHMDGLIELFKFIAKENK